MTLRFHIGLVFRTSFYRGGGGDGFRTRDLCVANAMLYQLSYTPFGDELVGQRGVEPLTSRLSGGRSNQLSYWPVSGCTGV